ncbi:MAG: elongation factor G [Chloroflexi bacterium HGW-Chloroflexi-10]|nr:MAG: elongation factor G [Chloroflexi bacterium HGW-Chloroflexi-10]
MKEYRTESIRNIALASHSGAGKSMLAEAFLFTTGAINRMGKIEDGSTVSDFDEEENRRSISIYTSVLPVEYKDIKINILDTPGYTDFLGEEISAFRVSDGVVILVDAVAGIEVGTELAWNYSGEFNLPRFIVINKMDRENANFRKILSDFQEITNVRLIPVQLPLGEQADFKGVIDLITMKAYSGVGKEEIKIPAEFMDAAEEAHMALIEAAAEGEDSLMEKFFEVGELSSEEIFKGLVSVVKSGTVVPVFATSATVQIGLYPLLDAMINLMPSPIEAGPYKALGKDNKEIELSASDSGPLAAYVWKTTADPFVGKQTYFRVYSGTINSDSRIWNHDKGVEERIGNVGIPRGKESMNVKTVHAGDIAIVPKLSETVTGNTLGDKSHPISLPSAKYPNALYRVAITPKTQADSTKISTVLTRLCEEDMTLSWSMEASTRQTVLQGMGDQHIEVAVRRAAGKFQLNVNIAEPKVAYKETITKEGIGIYRHKKQTGGSGQFGEVHLKVLPNEGEFEMTWDVFGGAVSQSYFSSIQKGILSTMKDGIIAGFPVYGVRVSVFDGKEHAVDSKPVAFEIAGREAFKIGFQEAGPVLMEPIMNVKITVPETNMGDILGDLNTRRARVQGMDTDKGRSVVTAQVPMAEMLRYTTQLRSLTGGRGIFDMEFDHFERVPAHLQQEIIDAHKREIEEKE